MRLLVTNDDGVRAPGIVALAQAMVAEGHDVVVAAPMSDRSGSGAAIGPADIEGEGIPLQQVELPGLEGVPAYGLDAPPALIVLVARLGALGLPPELVVSGINPGPNTGRSVLHSGTVGAALTGANMGVRGVAVSIAVGDPFHWETAGTVGAAAVAWVADRPAPAVVNVNVPNVAVADLAGVRWATLAPFGTVRTALTNRTDDRLQLEFRATEHELDPGTDTALVAAGYASVTELVGVRAAEESDLVPFIEHRLRS